MTTALTTTPRMEVSTPLGVQDILAQVRLIQEVMQAVMRDGEHFGKIPGCGDKPTLLQPGAQKLLMTFRLAPEYEVHERELERGHREYRVQCTLHSIQSGVKVGQGVGCCSTMEGKYRYRVAPKKLTDRPVPKEYWDTWKTDAPKAQLMLGGKGFGKAKNDDGQWVISEGSNEKVEHDNPADYYNTILKMAKKRALVDATITATAASDIFTQDIEDMPEVIPGAAKASTENQGAPTPPPLPKRPTETKQSTTSATVEAKEPPKHDWSAFPIPFGKNAGKAMGDIPKQTLWGFWKNFVVETSYNGKPKTAAQIEKDTTFRKFLDQAGAYYRFDEPANVQSSDDNPPDDRPPMSDEDVPF